MADLGALPRSATDRREVISGQIVARRSIRLSDRVGSIHDTRGFVEWLEKTSFLMKVLFYSQAHSYTFWKSPMEKDGRALRKNPMWVNFDYELQ